MANQTVTTVVNYDDATISGLNNGETITINGGSVTIDADVRWNQQAAVFGNVVLSATLGGSFLIDGTQIWEVPFSASSGNVPTQNALGSNGVTGGTSGATGELTRVWATGSLDPATAGGAMPATGFIKLRSKTGTFQNGETITLPGGATVTAVGAGKRSWIHAVGLGVTTGTGGRLTIPRLGIFEAEGDWYELGDTDGTDDQTFQFPVADACPAIWIETAPASGIYEIWLNAGDRWTNAVIATGDKRGQYFGMVNATGVITIAARTGNTAGLKPASGCKVRIPNIIMSQAIAANYAANNIGTSIAFRYGFTTTSAGSVVMSNVSCNWTAVTSAAFEIDISDSGIAAPGVSFANTGTTVTLNNVGIGSVQASSATVLTITTSYGGGSLTDVRAVHRLGAANLQSINITDAADFTLTRVRSDILGVTTTGAPVASAGCFFLARLSNSTLTDCVGIGAIGVVLQPAFSIDVINFKHASRSIGTTQTADTAAALSVTAGSTDIYIDGFDRFDGIANCHPYANIIATATGVDGLEIRNIGTPSVPYNMGTANPCGVIYAGSVTRNVTLRRLYAENTRTGLYTTANTIQGLQTFNVWGDAADSQANAAVNSTVRGGRFTNSVTGQSAVYGTHWQDGFVSTTGGRLVIACNEPTADTASQCSFTLDTALGSGFTSAGNVSMTQLTDVVEWTMPYYMLGVTGFANTAPTITGTNAANHTLEFQYDLNDGNGYNGTWLTLNGTNLSAITVDPNDGVKLKVKATVNTASQTNLLTYIRIDTVTNATDQAIQYPLPTTQNIGSVSNIRAGSRIRVYNVTTTTEIANEVVSGTTWTYPYDEGTDFTDGDVINVRLARCLGATASIGYEGTAVAGSTGWSLFADQSDDLVYNANGIDGTTVTEFGVDYPNVEVDINDPDGTTTITRLYAWWANERTTADGIRNLIGGLIAEDEANYKIITSRVDLKLDNIAATGVIFTGDLRLYRDDGLAPVVSSTSGGGSITLYAGKVYTVAVGSGVTAQDKTDIISGVWNATLASYQASGSTGEALDTAASGSGGGGTDWTTTERQQIRNRLGIDGSAATPSATPSLARTQDIPTADITAIKTKTDQFVFTIANQVDANALSGGGSGLDAAGVRSAIGLASANLDTQLSTIDTVVDAVKIKTDNLPTDPADESSIQAAISAIPAAPSASTVATAVRSELATELGRIDAATSTRLAAAGYTAPANADIAAILVDTGTTIPAQISGLNNLSAADVNAQVDIALSDFDGPTKSDIIVVNNGVKKASILVPHTEEIP